MKINNNLKKCAGFMLLMFISVLIEGFMTVKTGISYNLLTALSLASCGLSMVYWYRFADRMVR